MRTWKIAAIAALAVNSFAAENVAPTNSELEEMYSKAFRAFDVKNFSQALKELDAIDARQPDLAASQNLRGVVLMRQGIYDKAEAALLEAARIDPKFWNARFNLAEIPFLKKDWAEARNRFQQLLSNSESDLASEASQLIQYKILLTYLLEGKENMVDSILAKLELSPDTPAVDYVKAAVALQRKNEKEGRDWIAVAEKNFSPQLNKLFSESLYEVGWLEKPTGQARASLPLTTAAERSEKTKVLARSKFEQAQQALRQRDFATARKLIDEADKAEANQPATLNLRGEILMEQKEFDEAESAFKKAAKLDPKFREAQYNLAQIPFKKKDYAKARERFEALFKQTPGGDKNQASQLIKFKIYMTLLLEGKESRAQAMMEQFQFTGDTPALYYAQAAWEYKHDNPEKAADWTASAKKIYSPALNSVFADAFYDLGWMQSPEIAASSAPAFDTGSVIASQTEASPAIEPSPIPDTVVAANKQAERSKGESVASSATAANPPIPGREATSSGGTVERPLVAASNEPVAAGASGQRSQMPPAAALGLTSTAESTAAAASPPQAAIAPSASAGQNEQPASETKPSGTPVVSATPATTRSQATIWQSGTVTVVSRQTWLAGGLLLAGIFLLVWVTFPELLRRFLSVASYSHAEPLTLPRTLESNIAASQNRVGMSNHFFGGPPQVSLRLFESSMSPAAEQTAEVSSPGIRRAPELAEAPAVSELPKTSALPVEEPGAIPVLAEAAATPAMEPAAVAPEIERMGEGQTVPQVPPPTEEPGAIPVLAEAAATPAMEPAAVAPEIEASRVEAINAARSYLPSAVTNESNTPQIASPSAMPEQMTEVPTTPLVKAPFVEHTSQPASSMHTTVELAFSLEVASVQLTPTFKVAALQVRPTSKVVTMRLAPSEGSQPATNSEVTFEIAKIQLAGGALGSIEVIPSQQEKPMVGGSPSFAVGGLQFVPNSEAAPVSLTPSQYGRASVLVTGAFQISTIEFSPSFEIASIVLNSSSNQVRVQLPSAGPRLGEGGPMFEITNVQLGESGEMAMMGLNLLGQGPKQT